VNIEINKQNHLIFKIPLRSVFPFLPDNKVKSLHTSNVFKEHFGA